MSNSRSLYPNAKSQSRTISFITDELCLKQFFSLMTSFVWTLEPRIEFEAVWQISSGFLSIFTLLKRILRE